MLDEEKAIIDASAPANAGAPPQFLAQLARVEPEQALVRLRKLPDPTRSGAVMFTTKLSGLQRTVLRLLDIPQSVHDA